MVKKIKLIFIDKGSTTCYESLKRWHKWPRLATAGRNGETGRMCYVIKGFVLIAVLLMHTISWGAYPLITDDTGTQGGKKFQIEINAQYDSDQETAAGVPLESTGFQVATILSYGLLENADLVLSLPYQWSRQKTAGVVVSDEQGVSDTILEVKWRFFEKDGLSLALKPGVSFPTGNDEKGLGAGKTGYHLFIIGSKEAAPWAFHVNIGYIGNENRLDEEKNIWHASLAATYEVIKNLKFVGNVGIGRNPDKGADNDPAFVIGGLIYSLAESFDIDCGVKYGLTRAETEWSLMAGTAFRF